MIRKFEDLQRQTMEIRAREKYFVTTGKDFYKLSPTEQKNLIEIEIEFRQLAVNKLREVYDGVAEGDFSLIPGPGRSNGGYDR